MQPQVFLGIDLGKTEHHATAVDHDGQVVHDKPLPQSEPKIQELLTCLLYTSPSPRDRQKSRMPSSA